MEIGIEKESCKNEINILFRNVAEMSAKRIIKDGTSVYIYFYI